MIDNDTARACLYLVRRYAPGLMSSGGGSLTRESKGSGKRLSWHKRSRIVTLLKQGVDQYEVAQRVGCSQPTVSKIGKAAGLVRVPGRKVGLQVVNC